MARAHRGLGLLAAEEGNNREARKELELYLGNRSGVDDRKYIEEVLRKAGR
jgi:hypothetical protein